MFVTHSLVIFIGYLEFQKTCSGEYRSGGTPLFLLGKSVKGSGSGSGANLSLLVTSFITGDNLVEWRSLTSCWTFLEGSSLVVLVPPMLTETCLLAPSTCSFGTVSWQLSYLTNLVVHYFSPPEHQVGYWRNILILKITIHSHMYMVSDWVVTSIPFWCVAYPTKTHSSAHESNLVLFALGIWTNTEHPKTRGGNTWTGGRSVWVARICRGVLWLRILKGSLFKR